MFWKPFVQTLNFCIHLRGPGADKRRKSELNEEAPILYSTTAAPFNLSLAAAKISLFIPINL